MRKKMAEEMDRAIEKFIGKVRPPHRIPSDQGR